MPSLLDAVPCLALAIALAACAGLRAWLPLLLTGLLARAGGFELGHGFAFLAGNKALAVFGLATLVEIVGDKFPAVDHALDALSTVLRPAAGALLAASVFGRVSDPLTAMALGVAVGGPAALVPHAAKASLRVASSTFTAGLANPVISVAEDVATLALFFLAILVPLLLVLLLGIAVALVLRRRAQPRLQAS